MFKNLRIFAAVASCFLGVIFFSTIEFGGSASAEALEAQGIPAAGERVSRASGDNVASLLERAENLREASQYREAAIVLLKASQLDPSELRVWSALAATHREMSARFYTTGDLPRAVEAMETAVQYTTRLTMECISIDSPTIAPEIVVEEEKANAEAERALRAAIDVKCRADIAAANALAGEAYHSAWNILALGFRPIKNDRDMVVEGLKRLKPVFELSKWASENTRTSSMDSLSKLKKLVYPEEWDEMLARAGFKTETQ